MTIYPGGAGFTQSANGSGLMTTRTWSTALWPATPGWDRASLTRSWLRETPARSCRWTPSTNSKRNKIQAEYGWKPGAIVNVGVKSGTNSLHGSAYAYGRDTVFDARNYFNPDSAPAGAPPINATKQPVALEEFGATLGGALKKDKLFYFVNFESLRSGIGNPNSIKTPAQPDLQAACLAALALPPRRRAARVVRDSRF